MKTSRQYIVFILGIIFFLAAMARLIFVDKEGDRKYQNIVQENINNAVVKAKSNHKEILEKCLANKDNNFEAYKQKTTYPYFIFKNGRLVYWSDYKFVPDYKLVQGKGNEDFIEYNKNFGLLVKETFKQNTDVFQIASLINLYNSPGSFQRKQGFNNDLFYSIPATISIYSLPKSFSVNNSQNQPLFYIQPVKTPQNLRLMASQLTLILFSVAIILICIFCAFQISDLVKRRKYGLAMLNLTVLALFIRVWMYVLSLPWQLFSSTSIADYFRQTTTFGDLILNAFTVLVVLSFFSLWQVRLLTNFNLNKIPNWLKSLISVMLVLAAIFVGVLCYNLLNQNYENNAIELEHTLRYYLTNFYLVNYLYIFCVCGVFFLCEHLLINLFCKLHNKVWSGFFHWLYGSILAMLLAYYFDGNLWVAASMSMFFIIAYFLNLPRYFYILRFKTFVYFLLGAFTFTQILFALVFHQDMVERISQKEKFAKSLLTQRNADIENILGNFDQVASTDPNLLRAFRRDLLAAESIAYIVKDSLLDPYFYDFDLSVYAFKSSGLPVSGSSSTLLSELKKNYAQPRNKTDVKNLYYKKGRNLKNEYVLFTTLANGGGNLVLKVDYESTKVEHPAVSVSAKLLSLQTDSDNYSYALFDKSGKLIFQQGEIKYTDDFLEIVGDGKPLNNREIYNFGVLHYFRTDNFGNLAVVSNKTDLIWGSLSNISFLFLVSMLGIIALLLIIAFTSNFRLYKIGFSSKIQFYLNLAFLLPITLIIILTLAVVFNSLKNIQNRSLIENSESVSGIVGLLIQNYENGRSSKAYLEEQLHNLSKTSDFDLNIYNKEGKLQFASAPIYYRNDLVSRYINPDAFGRLSPETNRVVLESESIGRHQYKTVYVLEKGENPKNYGIIGVSYLNSNLSLINQIKEIIATILIIFFITFIMLLILSYTASTNLTKPLRLVAQHLKRTNLEGQNESLTWKTKDEIGVITSEYNRMIDKLEESKEALSASEKQTAWREMARQVAHEIKNPLTPIKLSIQQLQRTFPVDSPQTKERLERVLGSINEQIDNISEIANSFSEFAKMPVPKVESFDLVSAVRLAVDLFSQSNKINIDFESEVDSIMVNGDKMTLNRALNNLILNGIQSVPPSKRPVISVSVSERGETGLVAVHDNGIGISEEVRKKLFIPNFTTKVGGSGLGLVMSKRGIEHSGGNVWFETEEGSGTVFYIDLLKTKV